LRPFFTFCDYGSHSGDEMTRSKYVNYGRREEEREEERKKRGSTSV
jgi:hypothetical protein